jgi:predicted HD phosphohydrolase
VVLVQKWYDSCKIPADGAKATCKCRSPISTCITLKLYGGLFTTMESQKFIDLSGAVDAIQVRLWDGQAKSPTKATVSLASSSVAVFRHLR